MHDFHVNFNCVIFVFLCCFLQDSKNSGFDLFLAPYLMSYAWYLQNLITIGLYDSLDRLCRHKQALLGLLVDFELVGFIVLRFAFD
jgi:hypothetical protein